MCVCVCVCACVCIYGVMGVWVQLLGHQGDRPRVFLVVRGCIWSAPAVSLVLLAFDRISSASSVLSPWLHPR